MRATQCGTDYKKLLSRLCHLIALSETKKVESVVDSLVLALVEIDSAHPASDEAKLDEALRFYFGVQLDANDLRTSISRLLTSGALLNNPKTSAVTLSATSREAQIRRVSEAVELEQSVKAQWLNSIRECIDPSNKEAEKELWNCLKAYLTKLFLRHGAQTALVISGTNIHDADLNKSISDLMSEAISEECKTVHVGRTRIALQSFFAEQTSERARYVAQLLDATFSFYTLFTDQATQDYLKRAIPKITVFLDTNFLFGVLNLHNNPQNEVSVELVSIIREQQLPFELYYHEDSLREMQETIAQAVERLSKYKWPRGLSKAILSTREQALAGLEIKYHEANAEHEIDPATFFLKYRHAEKLLNENGFKIYRRPERHDPDEVDGPTQELISRYERFLEEHFPAKRHKPFNVIKHDMIVWKATKVLRKISSSGLDVGAFLLSADQRLFAFDWGVLSGGDRLGVVILPSQLLQLLRPFVPRTPDFDRKFAEIFALPEFRSVHSDFSQVTRRVLQFLASVKDISEETAVSILADELLLRRLKDVEKDDEIQAVIESEVIKKNAELFQQHKMAEAKLQTARAETEKKQVLLDKAEQDIREKEALASDRVAQLEGQAREQLVAKDKEKTELVTILRETEQIVTELQDKLAGIEASKMRLRKILRILGGIVFTLAGWALLIWLPQIENWSWLQGHAHKGGLYLAAFLIIAGLGWSIFAWRGRLWALGGVVLTVIIELIQVL